MKSYGTYNCYYKLHMWQATRKAVELDLGPMYATQIYIIQHPRLMPLLVGGGMTMHTVLIFCQKFLYLRYFIIIKIVHVA